MDIEATNPKADVVFSGWAFTGFIGEAKSQRAEKQVPIGVYQEYCDGRVHANAWMKNTPSAIRWEGVKLYEDNHE